MGNCCATAEEPHNIEIKNQTKKQVSHSAAGRGDGGVQGFVDDGGDYNNVKGNRVSCHI